MVRKLRGPDTAAVLRLLRRRPIHNVFLEHVVRCGGLGRLPGFYGHFPEGRLEGVLLIGPTGGTALAVAGQGSFLALATEAARAKPPPRHIVGPEDVTLPFWNAYAPLAPRKIWDRREPVYVLSGEEARADDVGTRLGPARESEIDQIVENSALQHLEDLGDDRLGAEPDSFRERHLADVRLGRWWVLREGRRLVFQVHVGPENDRVVQIGGVFTVPDRRNRGLAKQGVAAIARELLRQRPAVSLFCDEGNAVARHVYRTIGFRERFHYRSWLLEPF